MKKDFEVYTRGGNPKGRVTHVITSDPEWGVWQIHFFYDGVWRPRAFAEYEKHEYKKSELDAEARGMGSTGVRAEGMPKGRRKGLLWRDYLHALLDGKEPRAPYKPRKKTRGFKARR